MSVRATEFARLAERTYDRPEYIGWLLARYRQAEKKTDQYLARLLSLSLHDFYRLQLCLRPRRQSFLEDVQQIADHFAIDPTSLAKMIRHVEVLEAMKAHANQNGSAGLLMAARARSNRKSSTKKRAKNAKRPK